MTPLVFLHGVGGGHSAWDAQVSHFTRLGYRCTAWDQPGYGGKPLVDPYSFQMVAESLRGEFGSTPAVLVGHSMGGLVAQEFYVRHPGLVKALGLCFTSAAFVGGGEFARQFIAARIGALDDGKTMAEIAAQLMPTMRGSRSEPGGLVHAERVMASVPSETYRKAVALITQFDRRADLARIAVPTLLVAGSDDRTAPPAIMNRMAEKIPGARFERLEGCGHLGPMDQPEAFNQVLERFLRSHGL